MAPIDVIEAEAEVASNEEATIVAESSVATAQDALRALIFDPKRPDYWQITIQPTDTIQMQTMEVNVDAAITTALANRTDQLVLLGPFFPTQPIRWLGSSTPSFRHALRSPNKRSL